jgi:hypothetical protein
MERHFPTFKWWLGFPARHVLKDILGRPTLRMLRVDYLAALVILQDIGIDGVNLLQRTRLPKDAGIVNSIQHGLTDSSVRDVE